MDLTKEKVVIEIDPATNTYSLDVTLCNLTRLKYVLQDIVTGLEDGSLIKEDGVEIYDEQ